MNGQEDQWYIQHHDGQTHGPYSLGDLIEGARLGNVTAETLVAHHSYTQGKWIAASRVRDLAAVFRPQQKGLPGVEAPKQAKPNQLSIKTKPKKTHHHGMKVPNTCVDACFAIFDFRFRYFITPWIVRIQWALFVTFVLGLLALVIFNVTVSPLLDSLTDGAEPSRRQMPPIPSWQFSPPEFLRGPASKAFALFFFVGACAAALLYVRLILESVIVFFRIAEDLSAVREVADSK